MAEQENMRFTWGVPGDEIKLIYNDNNLRILRYQIILSAGYRLSLSVWDIDDPLANTNDPSTAFINEFWDGPLDNFNRGVPGNIRMVEVTDEFGTYLDVPQNWRYQFTAWNI